MTLHAENSPCRGGPEGAPCTNSLAVLAFMGGPGAVVTLRSWTAAPEPQQLHPYPVGFLKHAGPSRGPLGDAVRRVSGSWPSCGLWYFAALKNQERAVKR